MAINAPLAAASALYSTVRNLAATTKFFGFLPPHGRRLAAGEEVTVFGTVQQHLGTPRACRAFEQAIAGDNPVMALVQTPAVHLYDPTLDQTKVLSLDNNSFAAADPSWGTYSSSVG